MEYEQVASETPSQSKTAHPWVKETPILAVIIVNFLVILFVTPIIIVCLATNNPAMPVTEIAIDTSEDLQTLKKTFLSFEMAISFIDQLLNRSEEDLVTFSELIRPLSPGIIRIGAEDSLKFAFKIICFPDYGDVNCFNASNWLKFNKLMSANSFKVLFVLNASKRTANGAWDDRDANFFLNATEKFGIDIDVQLGYGPDNALNETVNSTQKAEDIKQLKKTLNNYKHLNAKIDLNLGNQKLVKLPAYLQHSLLNGNLQNSNSTVGNFDNTETIDLFQEAIKMISSVEGNYSDPNGHIETPSLKDSLSNKFGSTLLLLEILGGAAKVKRDAVLWDSLFGGPNALIDHNTNPTPVYWAALFHKELVGEYVYNATLPTFNSLLRIYAYSAKRSLRCFSNKKKIPTVVVIALNLSKEPAMVDFNIDSTSLCSSYIVEAPYGNLQSTELLINGEVISWKNVRKNENKSYLAYAEAKIVNELPPNSAVFLLYD